MLNCCSERNAGIVAALPGTPNWEHNLSPMDDEAETRRQTVAAGNGELCTCQREIAQHAGDLLAIVKTDRGEPHRLDAIAAFAPIEP